MFMVNLSLLLLVLFCNMIKLKVFYNISFAEDRGEVITTDESAFELRRSHASHKGQITVFTIYS